MTNTTTAAPITETEVLHVVTKAKAKGHGVASIQQIRAGARLAGMQFDWFAARRREGVVYIKMNGHHVATGFRSEADAISEFADVNS